MQFPKFNSFIPRRPIIQASPAPKKQDPSDGVYLKPESMDFVSRSIKNGYKVEILDKSGKFLPIDKAITAKSDEALIIAHHDGHSRIVNLFAQHSKSSVANDMKEAELKDTKLIFNENSDEAHLDKLGNVYINGKKVCYPFAGKYRNVDKSLDEIYARYSKNPVLVRDLMQAYHGDDSRAA